MKTRETLATRKIALLATGDEIANGDILNTNSQEIARRLSDLGMHIGMHAITADNIADIEKTILFLLKSHHALIITGGLGPTSDDLTRFAISNALNKTLIFHEPTWNEIVARLHHFGYDTPPESNRQQALFPEDATIIPNPNGTAAGCFIQTHEQFIFMLPGPPAECLPMLDTIVIPTLQQHQFQQITFHKSWMLFGVSEGQIAEELDALAKPFDCMTGYRIFYPYLEFKIHSNHEKDFKELAELVEKTVSPYLISQGTQLASEMLKEKLNQSIQIHDQATGGLLQATLMTPANYSKLLFTETFTPEFPAFILSGLNEFWQQKKECVKTSVTLEFKFKDSQEKVFAEIPNRGSRVKQYVVEWACYQITKFLNQ